MSHNKHDARDRDGRPCAGQGAPPCPNRECGRKCLCAVMARRLNLNGKRF